MSTPKRPDAAERTNLKAILSLICGIAGVFPAVGVGSVIAIVLGYLARSEIRASGEKGEGFATAGIALGWLVVVLSIGVVLLFTVWDWSCDLEPC